jgi:hypothetical protein
MLRSEIRLKYDEFNYPFVSQAKKLIQHSCSTALKYQRKNTAVLQILFSVLNVFQLQSSTPSDLSKGNEHSLITVRLYRMSLLSCPLACQLLQYVLEDTVLLGNKDSVRVETIRETLCGVIIIALDGAQLMGSVNTLEFRRNQ